MSNSITKLHTPCHFLSFLNKILVLKIVFDIISEEGTEMYDTLPSFGMQLQRNS